MNDIPENHTPNTIGGTIQRNPCVAANVSITKYADSDVAGNRNVMSKICERPKAWPANK